MRIEILLNPESHEFTTLQGDLAAEINAIATRDIRITSGTTVPPPGTLGVAEAVQFVIEHPAETAGFAALAKAVIELLVAVIGRHKKPGDDKQPVAILVVGEQQLPVPSSGERQKRFLKSISGQSAKRRRPRSRANKSKKKPRR